MEMIIVEDMKDISSTSTKASVVDHSITDPCSLFQKDVKLLLDCLGFEDSSSSASKTDPSTPTTGHDSPTSEMDREKDSKSDNQRPPIDSGGGGQTNVDQTTPPRDDDSCSTATDPSTPTPGESECRAYNPRPRPPPGPPNQNNLL